ncbi:DUF3658 domain-containing protein [Pseudomonas sp. MOB-449]|nr:DUF3658 domain-containing protein [Pseudomonas sp. MOB-449]
MWHLVCGDVAAVGVGRVTDFFAFWRARELVAQSRIELGGTAGQHGYGGLTVRLI